MIPCLSNFEALPHRNLKQLPIKSSESSHGRPKIRHQESSRGINRLLLWAPGSFPARARTHRTIYLNERPTLPNDPVTSQREPNSLCLPFEKLSLLVHQSCHGKRHSACHGWLDLRIYSCELSMIYDIYGKYIDRSIYISEDGHAFHFLGNYLGIESIQSHQSSMWRTQAGSTA